MWVPLDEFADGGEGADAFVPLGSAADAASALPPLDSAADARRDTAPDLLRSAAPSPPPPTSNLLNARHPRQPLPAAAPPHTANAAAAPARGARSRAATDPMDEVF
ncbi:hypothetical protein FA95DRAFT_1557745 [Auriscalpium vulgare]|uniref:Uncharacterized protein n=1 Tax=Auriscalpium vulgare TaxID=40419 RepID=A0ACB8RWX8_9AGAM|nr:hypothetical protein FA95DRAFT_1557745 [Auriscalpium vulgare]